MSYRARTSAIAAGSGVPGWPISACGGRQPWSGGRGEDFRDPCCRPKADQDALYVTSSHPGPLRCAGSWGRWL